MILKNTFITLTIFILGISYSNAQNVLLFDQFNGNYDFLIIGNTMNTAENNTAVGTLVTGNTSSAILNLNSEFEIEKAYLYWAGSGDGDFDVNLNSETIIADRTFSLTRVFNGLTFTYFSAFADVTSQILATGNGIYTLSDLIISQEVLDLHLQRRTDFAGWAIVIVYKNPTLPETQINIYDGLQGVPNNLTITLNNLNVLNNEFSKVGFLAWEGDSGLPTETFTINGIPLTNAQNPLNNVFNSSNSFTGSNSLFNMDIDVYDIENIITPGDTQAIIQLSSFQDFVMINTVVTKINNTLPDASVEIVEANAPCDSREVNLIYQVKNLESTNVLPAGMPISIYINGVFLVETSLENILIENQTVIQTTTFFVPEEFGNTFEITVIVDDANGVGEVFELDESNNKFFVTITLRQSPILNELDNLVVCNEGFKKGTFNFSSYDEIVSNEITDEVTFYATESDALAEINPILNTSSYQTITPAKVFVRVDNEFCFSITNFNLNVENCPPTIYNFISQNNDGFNDSFSITGIKDIFINYEIEIYNRWGALIWKGNNNSDEWKGEVTFGIKTGNNKAPDGTYFYVLRLNDEGYPEPYVGYVYITSQN